MQRVIFGIIIILILVLVSNKEEQAKNIPIPPLNSIINKNIPKAKKRAPSSKVEEDQEIVVLNEGWAEESCSKLVFVEDIKYNDTVFCATEIYNCLPKDSAERLLDLKGEFLLETFYFETEEDFLTRLYEGDGGCYTKVQNCKNVDEFVVKLEKISDGPEYRKCLNQEHTLDIEANEYERKLLED